MELWSQGNWSTFIERRICALSRALLAPYTAPYRCRMGAYGRVDAPYWCRTPLLATSQSMCGPGRLSPAQPEAVNMCKLTGAQK